MSSVPASTARPATASSPIGRAPTRSGTSRTSRAVDLRDAMAGVGAGLGVKVNRRAGGGKGHIELTPIECQRQGSGLEQVPLPFAWDGDRDELEVEATADRSRPHWQGLAAVGDLQHVSTEVEQACQLVSPAHSLLCPGARLRRQVAGEDADGKEGEQRDPVLRLGDRERADRRQGRRS